MQEKLCQGYVVVIHLSFDSRYISCLYLQKIAMFSDYASNSQIGWGTGNLITLSRTLGSLDPDENFRMSYENKAPMTHHSLNML